MSGGVSGGASDGASAPLPLERPAIGDYALIGDGRSVALVSRYGGIDWLCLPDISSPSVFARLLDPDGGTCELRPTSAFQSRRRYRDDTPILETEFETATGMARVIDFFPVDNAPDRLAPMREVVRLVEGARGTVIFDVLVQLRPDYGRKPVAPRKLGQLPWRYAWDGHVIYVATDIPLRLQEGALRGQRAIGAGERAVLLLAFSENDVGIYPLLEEAAARLAATRSWWTEWSGRCAYDGPFRKAVVRSAITLKLLTYCLSGAIVAAATTSLPEAIGGHRNWDYRYCWLRDAGLTVQALVGLGYMDEAGAFLKWLLHATRLTRPRLQVVYDVFGRTNLDEQALPHLAGYANSRPVRIGNAAHDQEQLDVYGEVILAADAYVRAGGSLEPVEARLLKGCGKMAAKLWNRPDHGLWEIRAARRHCTFSKFMCWLALDKLLGLDASGSLKLGALKMNLAAARDAIAEELERRGFNAELQAYTATLDGHDLDSSALLMGALGYRPAEKARLASTRLRLCRDLGHGPWLCRYAPGFDGSKEAEGAFLVLSFWAVQALVADGKSESAHKLFSQALQSANDVGLLPEEVDPHTGSALGNFPQAFSHTGLINAALALAGVERSAA